MKTWFDNSFITRDDFESGALKFAAGDDFADGCVFMTSSSGEDAVLHSGGDCDDDVTTMTLCVMGDEDELGGRMASVGGAWVLVLLLILLVVLLALRFLINRRKRRHLAPQHDDDNCRTPIVARPTSSERDRRQQQLGRDELDDLALQYRFHTAR